MAEPDSTTESTPSTSGASLPLPRGKDYHAFICFNITDQEWVDETIAYLESPEIGLKCVDHRRDFIPGKTIVGNIDEFIERSWKYVLVMTPEYVDSGMCKSETEIIMKMSMEQRKECVIPVLLKPCRVPRALSSLTYVDVNQSDRWKEKLVKAIKRTDIASKGIELSTEKMKQMIDGCRDQRGTYQRVIAEYKQDKRSLEAEKETLEAQVNSAFNICIRDMLDMMEKLRQKRIEDVHIQTDSRIATLVQKRNAAQKILSSLKTDIKNDTQALKNFTDVLDEYEDLERRHREILYTEFVKSNALVDKMNELMSEFDVGHLREMYITQVKSQEDRVSFLKAIEPSWAILPLSGDLTPWSLVRCPYFQFDPMTVHANRSILLDGSLYNKPPSRPHPPSDRRLRKYYGAVGSTRLTSGSIYYWSNKVDVNMEKELAENTLVFEVGLSTRGVYDEKHSTATTTGTLCLYVYRCTKHTDSVCMKVLKNDVLIHHQIFYPNKTGQWPPIVLGFLLDTISHRWTVYDVTRKEEITTVEDIDEGEEFTPMFGVYANISVKAKMSLITGKELNISDDMYNLIERALE